ncbi:MAG: T9SS type A sorting domain-containing protein [Bacteroidetes bacterium]|nr:T9SS type A sorting domain-containing protein [Bacteroidota bacterium]
MKRFFEILILLFLAAGSGEVQAQSITWQRTYGMSGIQYGYSIVQTPDKGYVAAGRKFSNIYVIRLNQFGDTIWTKEFPGFQATSLIKTSDSNYVILGIYGDVIKINLNGEVIWERHFGIRSRKIKENLDGTLFICGAIIVSGVLRKPVLLKLKANGDSIFYKEFLSNSFDGYFTDLLISKDSNVVICGNFSDTSVIIDKPFILKTDFSGNSIWFNSNDLLKYHYTSSIVQTNDNGFFVGGSINRSMLMKFDFNGIFQWKKIYDSLHYGECTYIINTTDSGYAFTGTWDSLNNLDYYVRLYKLDSNGNEIFRKSFGFNDNDVGYNICQTKDSGFAIIGIRDNFQNGDIYIIKTDKLGYANPIVSINNLSNSSIPNFQLSQNYPNPFNPKTIISYKLQFGGFTKLKIFNALGHEIITLVNKKQNAGSYEIEFDGSNISSGVYFYKLETEKFIQTKKMLLIK